jgi:hypothetical protein
MVGLTLQFLDLRRGPINLLLQALGMDAIHFMGNASMFADIYVWTGVWQNTGFATIIYLAALSTIDPSLHEAAVVDGANRMQRIWHIDIPGINAEVGSRVEITHRIGAGKSITRAGHVIRLQGQLDDRNRTATVLVTVDDPFDSGKSELPLLAGAYVTAKIACKGVVKGISLPREALYDGAFVWRVGDENRIQKSIVEVGWSTRDEVVVVAGLETRSQIVVSPIPRPIAGMKVAPLSEATVKTVNAAAGGESVKGRQTP